MKKSTIAFIVALVSFNAFALTVNTDSSFDELKKLEGKWVGTLERTDGTSDSLILEYTITSAGSAILEESNTGGVEMLSIFNAHNDELLVTHYCGLQNKPVLPLKSYKNGVFQFETDAKRSGLENSKEAYVGSWLIKLSPDSKEMRYEYTVVGPKGTVFKATSLLKRIG
ncbi:MAG: hypothetical protein HOM76_07900 [Flavobacteriaceae bacterium]|jgi:hypothetical protein|nr:hypothetical protein [Flavobacteriaceae bacterium]MBT5092321.1 hypothetical protein [Flavobacteriaceae bacterium]MBT5693442.1 hypothetical protein [Flavobacteriaceae bacterium]MBT6953847.1 hypothetical protein [Flavobacteriaceae bacterium]MBT7948285.1 hypothetical protein [Flavobacteriaceae bacterium]